MKHGDLLNNMQEVLKDGEVGIIMVTNNKFSWCEMTKDKLKENSNSTITSLLSVIEQEN